LHREVKALTVEQCVEVQVDKQGSFFVVLRYPYGYWGKEKTVRVPESVPARWAKVRYQIDLPEQDLTILDDAGFPTKELCEKS
jgi:hypothetical protein